MAVKSDPRVAVSTAKPEAFVHDTETCYGSSSTIPLEFRGIIADHQDIQILGKTQVFRRNFQFFTMLGFGSTIMCSCEYILPLFVFGLTNGGTALIFWGVLVVALIMALVYASLAELASMYPTAGGQYHWVSELTSSKWQKPLSYVVGWLTTIGWQAYLCGSSFITATIIQGLIALNVNNYVFHRWHVTLLTIAVIFAAVVFNTVLGRQLPLINGSLFVLHFTGFLAVVITLWVLGVHASSQVLLDFSNESGWPTTGLSAMIGLITPLSVLVGFDCSVHMSEEVQDASINLPRAMIYSVLLNSILAFVMAVTTIFTAGDIGDLLATATGQPFIQLFYNTTQNYTATNILAAVVVIMLFGSTVSQAATSSRQLWSFARDDGVPAATWLAKVSPSWDMPLHAVYVSVIITSLLACINLGSSTALNAITSLGIVSLLTSYLVTLACLIWRRPSGPPLPLRRWSLGRSGLIINVVAFIYLLPLWTFVFWPAVVPVTAVSMNWSSTIFCGIVVFALAYYAARGRHVYCGPVVHVKRNDN